MVIMNFITIHSALDIFVDFQTEIIDQWWNCCATWNTWWAQTFDRRCICKLLAREHTCNNMCTVACVIASRVHNDAYRVFLLFFICNRIQDYRMRGHSNEWVIKKSILRTHNTTNWYLFCIANNNKFPCDFFSLHLSYYIISNLQLYQYFYYKGCPKIHARF